MKSIAGSSPVLQTYLGHTIASHSRTQGAQIHDGECALRDGYVCSFARDDVESIVYEQMRRGVDQWTWAPYLVPKTRNRRACPTCVALDERVVALAIPILLNLLHVGSPVDLGVCSRRQLHVFIRGAERVWGPRLTGYFPDDESAERGVEKEEEGRKPFCVLGVAGEINGLVVQVHGGDDLEL